VAEIGDPADRALLVAALDDPRARVRAAALRATARLAPAAARAAALVALEAGRGGREGCAATAVLRAAAPSGADLARLEAVALGVERPDGLRLRALALMRPAHWPHLAALLRMRRAAPPALRAGLDRDLALWLASSGHVRRGPDERSRATIRAHLDDLGARERQALEFVLRTAP
jgi:hypothetical protein